MATYTKNQINDLRTYLWALKVCKSNLATDAFVRTAQRARARAKAKAHTINLTRVATCVDAGALGLGVAGWCFFQSEDNARVTQLILYLSEQAQTRHLEPPPKRAPTWQDLRKPIK